MFKTLRKEFCRITGAHAFIDQGQGRMRCWKCGLEETYEGAWPPARAILDGRRAALPIIVDPPKAGRQLKGIRIVSDGSVMGTRVYDAAGHDLTQALQVLTIEWQHHYADVPMAILWCRVAGIEVTTDAKLVPPGECPSEIDSDGLQITTDLGSESHSREVVK